MSLYGKIQSLLKYYDIKPNRRFSQNFMIDSDVLGQMLSYARLSNKDVVLEVGSGLGLLTKLLIERCKRVIAVEIDPKLVKVLRRECELQNLELVEGDVLAANIAAFDKVVSIPPYSISSPFLFWLFEKSFEVAVLIFQKELAKRLVAPVGSKCYRRLSVFAYCRFDVELLDQVSRYAFYPSPNVDSTIVRLTRRVLPPFEIKSDRTFSEVVQTLFNERNRKVRKAALPFFVKRGVSEENASKLANALSFSEKRVRNLAPEDFGVLSNEVLEKTDSL